MEVQNLILIVFLLDTTILSVEASRKSSQPSHEMYRFRHLRQAEVVTSNVTTSPDPTLTEEKNEELLQRIETLEIALETANRNLAIANGLINASSTAGNTRPADCADHIIMGAKKSGVYQIYPFTCLCSKPVLVYCDMETDGGGWTVFLNRQLDLDETADIFNRSWSDYKFGFGTRTGEFWLGNEHLHAMTSSREYIFRMDAKLASGDTKTAVWNTFRVANELLRFQLTLGAYSGESTARIDCFPYINSKFFTTYDRDNDDVTGNCAVTHGGGFWYHNCNGRLYPTATPEKGLTTNCFNSQQRDIVTSLQLKIRPALCHASMRTIFLNSYDCHSCN